MRCAFFGNITQCRVGITTLHCVIFQTSTDLMYIKVEAWHHTYKTCTSRKMEPLHILPMSLFWQIQISSFYKSQVWITQHWWINIHLKKKDLNLQCLEWLNLGYNRRTQYRGLSHEHFPRDTSVLVKWTCMLLVSSSYVACSTLKKTFLHTQWKEWLQWVTAMVVHVILRLLQRTMNTWSQQMWISSDSNTQWTFHALTQPHSLQTVSSVKERFQRVQILMLNILK